jgi:RHS repeat-associated protein
LTADGTYTYSYDSEGNMVGRTKTSNGEITTFTWDFRNRLTEVLIKSSGGVTLQDDKFTYDVENRRIGKNTLSGGQSWTGYDGANPFADFNSSGSLTFSYLYGNGIDFLLARLNTSFDPTWYLTDKLGSVRQVVNTSGSVVDTITYDSYGNIASESSPSNGDRFKFTSREWDSESGQYFERARYYNPGAGRFLSEDSLGFRAGDSNFYRYVLNQPTRSGDPSGLFDPMQLGPMLMNLIPQFSNPGFLLQLFGPAPPPAWQLPGFGQQMMARGQVSLINNALHMQPFSQPWYNSGAFGGTVEGFAGGCGAGMAVGLIVGGFFGPLDPLIGVIGCVWGGLAGAEFGYQMGKGQSDFLNGAGAAGTPIVEDGPPAVLVIGGFFGVFAGLLGFFGGKPPGGGPGGNGYYTGPPIKPPPMRPPIRPPIRPGLQPGVP